MDKFLWGEGFDTGTGVLPGWQEGSASPALGFVRAAEAGAVSGGNVLKTTTRSPASLGALLNLSKLPLANPGLEARVKIASGGSGDRYVGLRGRAARDFQTGYEVRLYTARASGNKLACFKVVGGVATQIGSYDIGTPAEDVWYTLTLRIIGSTLTASAFAFGDDAPASPQISLTGETSLPDAGVVGVVDGEGTGKCRWDNFACLDAAAASPLLSPEAFIAITDKLAALVAAVDPVCGDGSGSASASAKAAALKSLVIGQDGATGRSVYGLGVAAQVLALAPASLTVAQALTSAGVLTGCAGPLLSALYAHLNQQGRGLDASIVDVPSFLTYFNAWASLLGRRFGYRVAPDFARLYAWSTGGVSLLPPGVVFAPQAVMGTAQLTGANACTFTDGAALVTQNDVAAGIQGYAPANLEAVCTTNIGAGTAVLTVTGLNQDGVSRTWTVDVAGMTTGSVAKALTPTVRGDRCTDVTGIAHAGTAASGIVNIRNRVPRTV